MNPKKDPNPNFRTENLKYLNKKPNYEYVNPNKGRMKIRRINRIPAHNAEICKGPTFKVSKDGVYQGFNEETY